MLELCRLCGNKNNEVLDIFGKIGTDQKLEFKIKQVVHLSIYKEDPLPKIVCALCIKHLENALYFINCCRRTQSYLFKLYHENITNDSARKTSIESYDSITEQEFELSIVENNERNDVNEGNPENDINVSKSCIKLSSINSNNSNLIKLSTPNTEFNTSTEVTSSEGVSNETSMESDPLIEENPNRSQLRRKCSQKLTTKSQLSDDEHDSNSDTEDYCQKSNSDDYDSDTDDEENECVQNSKKTVKSKQIKLNLKRNLRNSKNCTDERLVTKTNVKENDVSKKESKEKKRFFCATCRKTFTQELTYQEHLNVHTGNRPFSCKLCTASFRRRQELNQHLRTIHSEKQFKCPLCEHVAKHKGKLTEHIKSVHDKPFACDMCNYRTGEKGKIMQHIANKHTGDLSFVCEICGNGFKTKTSLQTHIRNIHYPEPKVCQICGTVCPSLARYSSHIFRCGKEKKRYPCEKCGKSYVNKEILKDHMNKHLNIRPYKCEVCGKEFFQRNRLDTHKYVHRGAAYSCEICNQSFNRKDNMKNHMKRHFYKSMRYDDTIVTAV